jgi:hypothetical protein
MYLRNRKSTWQVVEDDGRRVHSEHKTRSAAESALELQHALNAWANGWNRLTPRQQELVQAWEAKREALATEKR